MATQVKLPRLGQGMDEGKILSWLKAEGDSIDKGDDLYEVETEKVNVEVEAPASGTVLKISANEGETVPIGTVIAWIGEPGEDVPDQEPEPKKAEKKQDSKKQGEKPAPKTEPKTAAKDAPKSSGDDRIKASPLARRMASEQGIELASIDGSGPDGRIIARDVEKAHQRVAASSPTSVEAAEGGERKEFSSMRRTIARRLTEAWQAPAFYLTREIDMSETNKVRAQMVASLREGDVKPTVSDIITRACAVALRQHPAMNSNLDGDAVIEFSDVHIGMAVATDAGLVVPIIRDAHAKTVREIAADRKAIVDKSRTGKLTPDDFAGGTFTISNLGMMGIEEFTAVLNPPMAAILAVGQTIDKPVVIDRRVEIQPRMTVTLGCDHRAVDGAVGARFLQTLAECLEAPMSMI